MVRLQQGKTERYIRLLTDFFALFIGKFGSQTYLDHFNSIQPGLGLMLLMQVWVPRLHSDLPVRTEAKLQVVGLTRVLCDTPAILVDDSGKQIWSQVLAGVMMIVTNPNANLSASAASSATDDGDYEEAEIGYDATYSRLHFASRPSPDPFPELVDPLMELVRSLHGLCTSRQTGEIMTLIRHGLQADQKLLVGLESLFQKAGLNLV